MNPRAYVARLRTRRTAEQREADVSRYMHDYGERRGAALLHVATRPLRSARTAADMFRLPRLDASAILATVEGTVIDRAVAQRHTRRRYFPHTSVLVLPPDPDGYARGPAMQTVRRMVRKAERAGITSRRVVDPAEQLELIRAADAWERTNPNLLYRDPLASNEDCLLYRLWLVAYARDGRPLAISVTPMAADWALLCYFRTTGVGTEQSLARYQLMQALAEQLVRNGVRYLADETSPARLPNGLRHYQRMVGFRLVRLRVHGWHLWTRKQWTDDDAGLAPQVVPRAAPLPAVDRLATPSRGAADAFGTSSSSIIRPASSIRPVKSPH